MISTYMQMIALLEISISAAVIFIWLLQKLVPGEITFAMRILLLFILGNLLFWPLGMSMQLPLAAYVRGVTGDLSLVTLLLLWSSILPKSKATPIGVKVAIGLIAILFYPAALGLGMTDPYAWGYGSLVLLIFVLIFAVICGLANWAKGVWILAFAIMAWSVHWHESSNLWDYVLDPFLAVWAIYSIFYALYRKRREKAQSGYLFRAG
jgi:hypothetical protein